MACRSWKERDHPFLKASERQRNNGRSLPRIFVLGSDTATETATALPRISVIGSDTATETATTLPRISRIDCRILQLQELLGNNNSKAVAVPPKSLCRCCIRPLIREIRDKAAAVSVAVSDPITEIRGKSSLRLLLPLQYPIQSAKIRREPVAVRSHCPCCIARTGVTL